MIEHARNYAARGWPVFPIFEAKDGYCACNRGTCRSPGKHPRVRGGLHKDTVDSKSIDKWWRKNPSSSIGLVTGEPSGLLALDVDIDKGGSESLLVLLSEIGALPPTLTQTTGSGGVHYLFQATSKRIRNSAGKLGKGIDVRGDGGYIIAPPSSHVCGGYYRWDSDPFNTPIAPIPKALLERISGDRNDEIIAHDAQIPEGKRNVYLTSLGGKLRAQGKNRREIHMHLLEINQMHCQPPLSAIEVDRIAASVSLYPITTANKSVVNQYRDWIKSPDGPKDAITCHILNTLTGWMDAEGKSCYPNITDIAAASKVAEKTVRTHLNRSTKNNWIGRYEINSPIGKWKSYGYFVPPELINSGN